MSTILWLDPANVDFPATDNALNEPNGLLAVGGDLSPERLIAAYRQGIFLGSNHHSRFFGGLLAQERCYFPTVSIFPKV